MNRSCYIFTCVLALCTACRDFPDPFSEVVESYSFSQEGLNQKAFAGEYLTDSIFVTVYDHVNQSYPPGMEVRFEIVTGDGTTDQVTGLTDSRGRVGTRWKLGSSGNEQILEALIYTSSGEFRSTIPFKATGFIRNDWNTITCQPDISIRDMAADSVSGITLAIVNSTLYKQGERFFDWNPAPDIPISMPRRIVEGKDKRLYIGTWDGRLFKSDNNWANWTECTKPWPDHSYYYQLQVTSDNYLWATAYGFGKGLRCSRDGGQTWSTDTIGLQAGEMLWDIFRLSDGTLFFHSENTNLSKSVDDGHTWTKIEAPKYPLKFYVTDQDELILINQINGISIYKSDDKGETFTLKKSIHPSYGTSMDHTVHRWGNDFYLLIPGYGILHTIDFEHYDTFWMNLDAFDMLMDAHGNFLVTELYIQRVHYYNNPQP